MFRLAIILCCFIADSSVVFAQQPNVLWILTDDQRYDSIQAFNRMLHGRDHSELGYVESPNVDRLAKMGTTFINTYCHAPGCAPSRASMHYGRYPFRTGIYEFEYHNNALDHCKPTLPEEMAMLGYQTMHVGKLGVRIKELNKNGKPIQHQIYQTDIGFKFLASEGLTDWGKNWMRELDGKRLDQSLKSVEFFVTPDGKFEFTNPQLEEIEGYKGQSKRIDEKYDLIRHYNKKKPKAYGSGMALSGVSSRKAGKTRDGYYVSIFGEYLDSANKPFEVGSRTFDGPDTSKPLFAHIGFDFPHTPVIPPKSYRDRFEKYDYKIPDFNEAELQTMAKQMKRQVIQGYTDHMSDDEKLSMIRDYFAFCAYGDTLVGKAVDDFIAYSDMQKQAWMVVYVCGDHGWKLNDHGSVSKFSPWDIDCHNPIIVVSSDKEKFSADKVVPDFTEFVDIAPTVLGAAGANLNDEQYSHLDGFDLAKIASGEISARKFVIGECHAVTGPRAFIRTKDYVFSCQTRPDRTRGKNMNWAVDADYKDLDPALYHMASDPKEVNNLAFDPSHEEIAISLKNQLLGVVFKDRVEVDWGKWGEGTTVFK